MRVLILSGFLSLCTHNAFGACPSAPVGVANDPVVQLKSNVDGKSGFGPSNFLTSNEEGAIVWDDTKNAVVYCDGTNWITLGKSDANNIQIGFDNFEVSEETCLAEGSLSRSSSGELLVCQTGIDIDGLSCSNFNPGALSIDRDGSIYICTN